MDNELFFGIWLKKTGEMLSSQVTRILSDNKIEFEPRGIYLLIILRERIQASIKEIANLLGMTHPAIVQIVNSLNSIGLITQSKSVDDKLSKQLGSETVIVKKTKNAVMGTGSTNVTAFTATGPLLGAAAGDMAE